MPPLAAYEGLDWMKAHGTLFRAGVAVAVAVVALDQISKYWVLEVVNLDDLGKIELSSIFDLSFVRNHGVSFGLLKAGSLVEQWGLMALSAGIAAGFLMWMRTAERRLTTAALALVVGGAIGNLIDRARFGYVVDFLDFSGFFFPWVFNVADASITVGATLLVLDYLVHGEERAPKANEG